jgi:hypothetical protein
VVRVSIEVRNGATRFRVGIQASSIQRGISLVGNAFHSADGDVRVVFPIDPEGFFVEDALAEEGPIEGGKLQDDQEELAA